MFHDDGGRVGVRIIVYGGNLDEVQGRKVFLGLAEIANLGRKVGLGHDVVNIIHAWFEEADVDVARRKPGREVVERLEGLAVGGESGFNAAAFEFDDAAIRRAHDEGYHAAVDDAAINLDVVVFF